MSVALAVCVDAPWLVKAWLPVEITPARNRAADRTAYVFDVFLICMFTSSLIYDNIRLPA